MIQTLALFLDAYRELNSKKLFWISIVMSAVVVLIFLAVGIDHRGVTLAGYHLPFGGPGYNSQVVSQATFFRAAFFQFGVNWWLTWIATILALISTAGIFPDLISGGSIDLYFSKPISRLRLFLTKYLTGLLFVGFQVSAFVVGSVIVMRVRGGGWFPKTFLAVPVVLLFYSYIYSVCVLLGVLTRSTITAILLTIVFWFAIGTVQWFEADALLAAKVKTEMVAARLDRSIAFEQHRADTGELKASIWKVDTKKRIEDLRVDQEQNQKILDKVTPLHHWTFVVESIFPKTEDTVALLRRWLISSDEDKRFIEPDKEDQPAQTIFGPSREDLRADAMAKKIVRDRSLTWSIGTSLIFELVVLSLAAWMFCRRDY